MHTLHIPLGSSKHDIEEDQSVQNGKQQLTLDGERDDLVGDGAAVLHRVAHTNLQDWQDFLLFHSRAKEESRMSVRPGQVATVKPQTGWVAKKTRNQYLKFFTTLSTTKAIFGWKKIENCNSMIHLGQKSKNPMARVILGRNSHVTYEFHTIKKSLHSFHLRLALTSISCRSCLRSDSFVRSNSRSESRNCATWYGPPDSVTCEQLLN